MDAALQRVGENANHVPYQADLGIDLSKVSNKAPSSTDTLASKRCKSDSFKSASFIQ